MYHHFLLRDYMRNATEELEKWMIHINKIRTVQMQTDNDIVNERLSNVEKNIFHTKFSWTFILKEIEYDRNVTVFTCSKFAV